MSKKTNPPTPFARLMALAEGRKWLVLTGSLLSFLGHIIALIPFVLLTQILQLLFEDASLHYHRIIQLGWWSVVAGVGYLLLYFTALMLCHFAAFRVERNIRLRTMERIVSLPLGFFDRQDTGKIKNSVDDNAALIHTFIAHQLSDIAGVVGCFLMLIVLFFTLDWVMGLIAFVPLLISMIAMGMMMNNKEYQESMTAYMNHLQQMNSEAVEYIRGIPVVKAFQQSIYSFNSFYGAIKAYEKWVRKYADSCKVPMSIYTIASHSYAFLLIPCAIIQIQYGVPMERVLSNLIFFLLVTPFVGTCTLKLMYLVSGKRQSEQALTRIDALLEGEAPLTGEQPFTPEGYQIELMQVSFRYSDEAPLALDSVSLTIPEGHRVALVGASGSGKTTLARLIARFWDPTSGQITIGGVDLQSSVPEEILQHISFVFQHEHLFKVSLRDNITYGCNEVSEESLQKAIDAAQCREIIDKLPDGLDTMIGAEGIYLSGGEQQRIALARALLNDRPILLLDEATAFADPENEQEIQAVLRHLMKGKTVVMIAHRLTSVTDADKIVVMDHGKIVEEGTHTQLIEEGGRYLTMWNEYQKSIEWTI